MPKRVIDTNLINSILAGNKAAFHFITDEWYDVMLYYIKSIVKNKETAEDLTNELFVKIYDNLHLFKPNHVFSAWIYKIATNMSIDYLRKQKLQPDMQHQIEDHDQFKPDLLVHNTPETDLINKQNYATLRDAIIKLKPKYRTIIQLRYYEELSYEEIAKRLSMPIGTVKAYIHRAKSKLAQIIINQQK